LIAAVLKIPPESLAVFLLAGWIDGDKFQVAFVVLKGSSSCD